MINFRYHLVSIVAVLLALAVGIIVGSGLLGGPLLEDLENRADRVRETNQELRDLAEERLAVIDDQERFAAEVEPRLVQGALRGVPVVVLEVAGTDPATVEALHSSVGLAEGDVAATIRLHDKFALQTDVERDLLALAVASTSADPEEVRADAATRLAARIAAAAQGSPRRLRSLLTQLEEGDFLTVEAADTDGPAVPPDAAILVVAGADMDPPFDVAGFVVELGTGMAERGVEVLVAEPAVSRWNVVGSLRGESDARDKVATASGVDLASGRIAAVLGLAAALEGDIRHLGPGEASDLILPPVTPPS